MIEVVESRTLKAPRPHGKEVDWWELGEGVEGVWLGPRGRTWRHMYQYPAYGRGLADAAFPSYGIPGVYRLYSGRAFALLGMVEAATKGKAFLIG